jgi:hypothetical protein
MFCLIAALGVVVHSEVPDVEWVFPQEKSWPGLDFDTLKSLPCELEWDEKSLGPDAVLEYQFDTLDDLAEWLRFTNGPSDGQVEGARRRVRNVIDFEEGSRGHRFIRARLRRGGETGRSMSAFFVGRDEQLVRPSLRYVGPEERRVRSSGPVKVK